MNSEVYHIIQPELVFVALTSWLSHHCAWSILRVSMASATSIWTVLATDGDFSSTSRVCQLVLQLLVSSLTIVPWVPSAATTLYLIKQEGDNPNSSMRQGTYLSCLVYKCCWLLNWSINNSRCELQLLWCWKRHWRQGATHIIRKVFQWSAWISLLSSIQQCHNIWLERNFLI